MPTIERLFVTITERCNMRCPHCWVNAGIRNIDYKEITIEEIKEAIDLLIPYGLKAVKITGGEPFIRKNEVFEILDYCSKLDLHVTVESNLVLLDYNDIERLSKHHFLEIAASLDYPEAQDFDSFRRSPGSYNLVIERLMLLAKNHVVSSAMAVTKDNVHLMEAVANIVISLGCSVRYLLCNDIGRGSTEMAGKILESEEILDYYAEIHRISHRYPKKVNTSSPLAFCDLSGNTLSGRCEAEKNISILSNGSIALCGIAFINEDEILGNIRKDSLVEVIATAFPLVTLRQICDNKVSIQGVCSECLFMSVCAPFCPALSMETYGTHFKSYPVCQRLYEAGVFPNEFLVNEVKHGLRE